VYRLLYWGVCGAEVADCKSKATVDLLYVWFVVVQLKKDIRQYNKH
jgi:hypothetical protein